MDIKYKVKLARIQKFDELLQGLEDDSLFYNFNTLSSKEEIFQNGKFKFNSKNTSKKPSKKNSKKNSKQNSKKNSIIQKQKKNAIEQLFSSTRKKMQCIKQEDQFNGQIFQKKINSHNNVLQNLSNLVEDEDHYQPIIQLPQFQQLEQQKLPSSNRYDRILELEYQLKKFEIENETLQKNHSNQRQALNFLEQENQQILLNNQELSEKIVQEQKFNEKKNQEINKAQIQIEQQEEEILKMKKFIQNMYKDIQDYENENQSSQSMYQQKIQNFKNEIELIIKKIEKQNQQVSQSQLLSLLQNLYQKIII